MIIDRHNYEECFILYWDDELTAFQKQAVEDFVKSNPDLQEEFKLLGETRFTPDNKIQFEEKAFLLNNSFININNYQEQLLNYIDDELDADKRKEVELSLSKNPTVQKELNLLLKTKIQPEADVVFADKSILYRKEEKVRVISMTWFRVAIAAAIILIAGFATLKLVNTDESEIEPSMVNVEALKTTPSVENADQSAKLPKDQTTEIPADLASTATKSSSEQIGSGKRKKDENVPSNALASRENKNNLSEEVKKPDQVSSVQDNNETYIASADIPLISKDLNKAEKSDTGKIDEPFNNSSVTDDTRFTSNIMIDDEPKEKGGIKEFLRKTTRVFERRTKIQTTTEDNKLLVGAFAVSLK